MDNFHWPLPPPHRSSDSPLMMILEYPVTRSSIWVGGHLGKHWEQKKSCCADRKLFSQQIVLEPTEVYKTKSIQKLLWNFTSKWTSYNHGQIWSFCKWKDTSPHGRKATKLKFSALLFWPKIPILILLLPYANYLIFLLFSGSSHWTH